MTAQQEIIASIASNCIAVLMLLVSWKRKNTSRILFSILFIWAAVVNWSTAYNNPKVYLEYGSHAIPLYKSIIYGDFSNHITGYVRSIAICQFFIGAGLLSRDIIVKASCMGGMFFLLAIAPLGLGAAFPFSITASVALWILYRHRFTKNILGNKWLV